MYTHVSIRSHSSVEYLYVQYSTCVNAFEAESKLEARPSLFDQLRTN
jgi:hypothetical protein